MKVRHAKKLLTRRPHILEYYFRGFELENKLKPRELTALRLFIRSERRLNPIM